MDNAGERGEGIVRERPWAEERSKIYHTRQSWAFVGSLGIFIPWKREEGRVCEHRFSLWVDRCEGEALQSSSLGHEEQSLLLKLRTGEEVWNSYLEWESAWTRGSSTIAWLHWGQLNWSFISSEKWWATCYHCLQLCGTGSEQVASGFYQDCGFSQL